MRHSVYATCLFCNHALGANAALEAFPVGRRLAYDAAKGRLWVVCRRCERWNLTPLEERWEAIEQAERLYRGTRLRTATAQVGLARVADGTELIRIGRPLLPEFAAWRYGDQFGRRRLRQVASSTAALTVVGGVAAAGIATGAVATVLGAGLFGGIVLLRAADAAISAAIDGRPGTVVARWRDDDGLLVRVRRDHLRESRLEVDVRSRRAALRLRRDGGERIYAGDAFLGVAARVFPPANRFGGSRREVAAAVPHIDREGGSEGFVEALARPPKRRTRLHRMLTGEDKQAAGHLLALKPDVRLAIEMAAHDERERRALAGELAVLERAWREAEEIAAIADALVLPAAVEAAHARLRARTPPR